MANIFNMNNDDDDNQNFSDKLNMDDLYERKQNSDMLKLNSYKKILNRIHTKIKTTCRISKDTHYCWFVVPEVVLGMPFYDHTACIEYVIQKLDKNGFVVRYNHPNALYISWNHWVPGYVRNEIKKKTGVEVDGYGNMVEQKKNTASMFANTNQMGKKGTGENKHDASQHKDISTYKPTGRFIYEDIFKK